MIFFFKRKMINFFKEPFNNYMDKVKWWSGSKMSVFVHTQGTTIIQEGGWGQKMAKFCPRSY